MLNKLVTVGVPTYNRPDQLTNCLNKLIEQTYPYLEILVSDNHSTNYDAIALLEGFVRKDSRIRFIIQDQNIGGENNFNYLFNQAQGEYFIWLSDDDYFENDYIEKCVEFLSLNKDYISCAGSSIYIAQNKKMFEEHGFSLDSNSGLLRVFNYFYKVGKNGIFYGVFKREALEKSPLGNYIGSDWSLVANLAMKGKIKTLQTVHMFRSLEGGSTNRNSMTRRWKLNKIQTLFFETYCAYKVSSNLFIRRNEKNLTQSFNKTVLKFVIFIFLNIKFFLRSILRRLGYRFKN
ncbi:MAG TPA: glycosyltransferase family 2 protein [Chitinophagaceae bacterium]|nr:glycosyltransferase family 2 protein [Chitinophagaceae bacterium]